MTFKMLKFSAMKYDHALQWPWSLQKKWDSGKEDLNCALLLLFYVNIGFELQTAWDIIKVVHWDDWDCWEHMFELSKKFILEVWGRDDGQKTG